MLLAKKPPTLGKTTSLSLVVVNSRIGGPRWPTQRAAWAAAIAIGKADDNDDAEVQHRHAIALNLVPEEHVAGAMERDVYDGGWEPL